jgi:maleamate amidohydrolase
MDSPTSIYAHQVFGQNLVPGNRTALLIVDFTNGFNDPNYFGGGNIAAAIGNTVGALSLARTHNVPVCYSRIVYPEEGRNPSVFQQKALQLAKLVESSRLSHIVDELAPRAGDFVIAKKQPSAFFDTALHEWLLRQHIDNLVITGCTTSGCVRATVVDGMSHNYKCFIAENCVGDRSLDAHAANLFDIQQKYGDLVDSDFVHHLFKVHQSNLGTRIA